MPQAQLQVQQQASSLTQQAASLVAEDQNLAAQDKTVATASDAGLTSLVTELENQSTTIASYVANSSFASAEAVVASMVSEAAQMQALTLQT